jgi:hypothetical protein
MDIPDLFFRFAVPSAFFSSASQRLGAWKNNKPVSPRKFCASLGDTQTGPTFSRSDLGAGRRKILQFARVVKPGGAVFLMLLRVDSL